MKLFKFDTIPSTNDFLRESISNSEIDDFTIITADYQTRGRGQRGAKWDSEKGRNLMASVLIKNIQIYFNNLFDLNIVVSLSVFSCLNKMNISDLSIKWPNDIMSGNKKIGGILIENIFKSDGNILSIVGLGLNVNQINFEQLPKATSLSIIMNTEFDKELILNNIVESLKLHLFNWQQNHENN